MTYCRIAERSSHTWFVLSQLLGYADVRNYDGSWTEWRNPVGVPFEVAVPLQELTNLPPMSGLASAREGVLLRTLNRGPLKTKPAVWPCLSPCTRP
ncbi:rhodanese-like domain-containing protein [Deinococcus navajonensis]|uniref:Rhodanese-like domain-containing protein n=1 Tax=Deinococcus navajonensis TaxID=309884 RepID=A0ABV8XKB2_9DEIO